MRLEALAVYASLAILAAGLLEATRGPVVHAALMTSSVLVFYSAVASAYVASAAPRSNARPYMLASIPLYAVSPATPLFYTLASLVSAAGVAVARRSAPRVVHTTLDALASVYAFGAAAGVYAALAHLDPYGLYTLLVYAVPAAACIPVNLHALTHTYRAGDPRASMLPALALYEAGVAARYALGSRLPLQAAAGYYAALTALLATRALGSRVFRAARGPARRAHLYTAWGEYSVAGFYAAYAALLPRLDPILEAHMLAMGLVASHVYLHAPLMLPVILGLPASRLYNPLPQLLLAASLAERLANNGIALHLFAASLAVLAVTTARLWPGVKRGSPGGAGGVGGQGSRRLGRKGPG